MGFIGKLIGSNKKESSFSSEEILEAGACPNCWGIQEYGGEFRKLEEDYTKSNINHDKSKKKAFIAQFVETNVTGIRLKKDGNQMRCPKCKKGFKTV